MLLAYPKGFPLRTTYFHRLHPNIDNRSLIVSIDMTEDLIHEDLLMIKNLEMVLESSLQHENMTDDKTTRLTGTAIMYPGLEPYEGDLFYLDVGNSNFILFVIQGIVPTTYRQERYYRVSFTSTNTLDKVTFDRIQAAVTETCYFEKKKYFGESELTFLSTESYEQLKTLEHYRKAIGQDIVNFFFDRDNGSFFRPDGVYDPYVAEFLRSKLSVLENRVRACQLVVPFLDFHKSIWYKFIDAENKNDLSDLYFKAQINRLTPQYYAVSFNGLTGKYYLTLTGETDGNHISGNIARNGGCNEPNTPTLINDRKIIRNDHTWQHQGYVPHQWESNQCSNDPTNGTYIFSERFYRNDIDSGSDALEIIVHDYLTKNLVNIQGIIDMVSRYRKLGRDLIAFYRFTIYLELIDAAIIAVK